MKTLALMSLTLCSLAGLAAEPDPYEVALKSIKRTERGNFVIAFSRPLPDGSGKIQNVKLVDDDGLATLAATQLALVEAIRKEKTPRTTMQTELRDIFKNGETRVLSIQRDALDAAILIVSGELGKGNHMAEQKAVIEKTVERLKTLKSRFDNNEPWRIQDVEDFGKVIASLKANAGPYEAEYAVGNTTQKFKDVRIEDRRDPANNLLSGSIYSGFYLPSQWIGKRGAFSKSHVYLRSENLANLESGYSSSKRDSGFHGPRTKGEIDRHER